MSLRLALIRQRYNPFGGAERFVERALGALVADGAAVTLITRSWAGADRNGFSELICDPAYSRLLGGRAARDRSFSTAVQGLLAKGGYDITQSHAGSCSHIGHSFYQNLSPLALSKCWWLLELS